MQSRDKLGESLFKDLGYGILGAIENNPSIAFIIASVGMLATVSLFYRHSSSSTKKTDSYHHDEATQSTPTIISDKDDRAVSASVEHVTPAYSCSVIPDLGVLEDKHEKKEEYLPDSFRRFSASSFVDEENVENLKKPGYLKSISLTKDFKNLTSGFSWEGIPQLAVITGKNGIGKTRILEVITQGLEDVTHQEKAGGINCNLSSQLKEVPQIFFYSSSQNREDRTSFSKKNYEENFNQKFEDLKIYHLSKNFSSGYMLKFPDLKRTYDSVIFSVKYKPDYSQGHGQVQADLHQRLKIALRRELGTHISTYGSLETYCQYLLRSIYDIKDLNTYLKEKGFKYEVSEKSYNNLQDLGNQEYSHSRLLVKESGKHANYIESYSLSPGENLEMLTLLWLFEVEKRDSIGTSTKAVLLLDEPDAHLHPSLAKEVIETIKTRLVLHHKMQVIITTHNPTTVSMAPKESLFIMSNNNPTKETRIERATSKKQAIHLLTSDFVCVNEPFRMVFVEANNDIKFYQLVQRTLTEVNVLHDDSQILFMAHGKKKKDGEEGENSSRDMVERLVEKLVEADEDRNFAEQIFGLVDGDNKGESKKQNVIALKRYSFENYLFDPAYLFYALKKMQRPSFFLLNESVEAALKKEGLKLPGKFSDLVNQNNKEKQKILQIIIDAVSDIFIQTLQKAIDEKDPVFKEPISKLKEKRFNLIESERIVATSENIVYIGDIQLKYPKILLNMRGHDLVYTYGKIFLDVSTVRVRDYEKASQPYISIMLNFCREEGVLIPQEFIDIFKRLQSPIINSIPIRNEQIQSGKSKKEESKSSPSHDEMQALRDKVISQKEEIKRQAEQIKRLKAEKRSPESGSSSYSPNSGTLGVSSSSLSSANFTASHGESNSSVLISRSAVPHQSSFIPGSTSSLSSGMTTSTSSTNSLSGSLAPSSTIGVETPSSSLVAAGLTSKLKMENLAQKGVPASGTQDSMHPPSLAVDIGRDIEMTYEI